MTKISEALTYGLTIRESANDGSDFTNPATDYRRLFLGEDGSLHLKDSSGTVTAVGGGAASFSGCKVYNNATQSFDANTATYITYNSEVYDTSSYHSTSVNTSRLVAPSTGYYRVTALIWYGTSSGTNYILFDIDHAGDWAIGGFGTSMGDDPACFLSSTFYLTANQYVEVVGFHTQSGSQSTGNAGSEDGQYNWATMEYLGA